MAVISTKVPWLNARRGSVALSAWKREFHGALQSERTKGIGDANVPPGACDLDDAQLSLCWLASLDVAAYRRALPSSVAIQPPRADRPKTNDPFSRSLRAQTKSSLEAGRRRGSQRPPCRAVGLRPQTWGSVGKCTTINDSGWSDCHN
jgi:hypothetical protein